MRPVHRLAKWIRTNWKTAPPKPLRKLRPGSKALSRDAARHTHPEPWHEPYPPEPESKSRRYATLPGTSFPITTSSPGNWVRSQADRRIVDPDHAGLHVTGPGFTFGKLVSGFAQNSSSFGTR